MAPIKNDFVRPTTVALEASSICQLKCPSCPTTKGTARQAIKPGFLKFEYFKALIEKNPWIQQFELSNFGEIFLNPELLEIMRLAHEKKIKLTATNGVNLNTINADVLEGLVRYEFRMINCSIDGATQDVYEQYRRGGDFSKVIANIQQINHFKKYYQSEFPILSWQFIIFGLNEHQIDLAKKMAEDLNMKINFKLSWEETFSPVQDHARAAQATHTGAASREEYTQKKGKAYLSSICHQLWEKPQVNWDGKILGCCVNFWSDFGRVENHDLTESFNNEKLRQARRLLQGQSVSDENLPCLSCHHYKKRKALGHWVSENDIGS